MHKILNREKVFDFIKYFTSKKLEVVTPWIFQDVFGFDISKDLVFEEGFVDKGYGTRRGKRVDFRIRQIPSESEMFVFAKRDFTNLNPDTDKPFDLGLHFSYTYIRLFQPKAIRERIEANKDKLIPNAEGTVFGIDRRIVEDLLIEMKIKIERNEEE